MADTRYTHSMTTRAEMYDHCSEQPEAPLYGRCDRCSQPCAEGDEFCRECAAYEKELECEAVWDAYLDGLKYGQDKIMAIDAVANGAKFQYSFSRFERGQDSQGKHYISRVFEISFAREAMTLTFSSENGVPVLRVSAGDAKYPEWEIGLTHAVPLRAIQAILS